MFKGSIAATLAALSLVLAYGVPRSPSAKMAGEHPMPIEAHANAETKPGETIKAGDGALLPPPPLLPQQQQSPLKLPLVNP